MVIGTSRHDQLGRRTSGHNAILANTARQNASGGPFHPARYGDFTKNPLVLHSTAATNTNHRAAKTVGPRPAPSSPATTSAGTGCSARNVSSPAPAPISMFLSSFLAPPFTRPLKSNSTTPPFSSLTHSAGGK